MADQSSLRYDFTGIVTEILDIGLDNAANPAITHTLGALRDTLTASSTVPVTKTYSQTKSLVAGASSLDLDALPGPKSTTISFDGLKVQFLIIKATDGNSGAITFDIAAVEGYNLFGPTNATDESVAVPAGGIEMRFIPNNGEDVASNFKDKVDITGTGTDSFSIILVAG